MYGIEKQFSLINSNNKKKKLARLSCGKHIAPTINIHIGQVYSAAMTRLCSVHRLVLIGIRRRSVLVTIFFRLLSELVKQWRFFGVLERCRRELRVQFAWRFAVSQVAGLFGVTAVGASRVLIVIRRWRCRLRVLRGWRLCSRILSWRNRVLGRWC